MKYYSIGSAIFLLCICVFTSNTTKPLVNLSTFEQKSTIQTTVIITNSSNYLSLSITNDTEESENYPLLIKKSTVINIEISSLILFFCLTFFRGLWKRRERTKLQRSNGMGEKNLSLLTKAKLFLKNIRSNAPFLRLGLFLASLGYVVAQFFIIDYTYDVFSFIIRIPYYSAPAWSEWFFYSFIFCMIISNSVVVSTNFLASTTINYIDLFSLSQIIGEILLIIFIPSSIALLVLLIKVGFLFAIVSVIEAPIFLGVVVIFLRSFKDEAENQPHNINKLFLRKNKPGFIHKSPETNLIQCSSKEQFEEYKLKFLYHIINNTFSKTQVSINYFVRKFQVSNKFAHDLLVEIDNSNPDLGIYSIEEQIYSLRLKETMDNNQNEKSMEKYSKLKASHKENGKNNKLSSKTRNPLLALTEKPSLIEEGDFDTTDPLAKVCSNGGLSALSLDSFEISKLLKQKSINVNQKLLESY